MTQPIERLGAACLALALVVGACSAGSSGKTGATYAEDRDHAFFLSISTPRQVWAAGEAIDVSASLS